MDDPAEGDPAPDGPDAGEGAGGESVAALAPREPRDPSRPAGGAGSRPGPYRPAGRGCAVWGRVPHVLMAP
ncbi:hypothetical protein ACWD6I_08735 [Streptomyces sp. NPDC002454]